MAPASAATPTAGVEKPISAETGPSNPAARPAITFDGTNYLMVWEDRRAGSSDLYGAHVSPEGAVLSPGVFPVSTAPGDQTDPTVSAGTSDAWVAWTDGRSGTNTDIYGTTIAPGSGADAPDGIALVATGADETDPDVEFGGPGLGGAFQLAFAQRAAAGDYDVFLQRIGDTFIFSVSEAVGDQRSPAIGLGTDDGGVSVETILYADHRSTTWDVRRSFVDSDGFLNDRNLGVDAGDQIDPDIVWSNGFFVAAWTDGRSGSNDIYGAAIDKDGNVLLNGPISTAVGDQTQPEVEWDGGSKVLFAWRDRRSGTNEDLYGNYIQGDGTLETPDGFVISNRPSEEGHPAIARGPENRIGIGYDRVIDGGTTEVFFRRSPK